MNKRRMAVLLIPEDGGYRVHVPDVPGAITFGDTEEQALAMAQEAVDLVLASEAAHGDDVPDGTPAAGILVREIEVNVPMRRVHKAAS